MAVAKALLWIGIGLALLFHVIVFLIKFIRMEEKKVLLETAEAQKILSNSKISVKDAKERLEKHYKAWQATSKNKPKPTNWKFSDSRYNDPTELAKEIVKLVARDRCTERKNAVRAKINEFSGDKQAEILSQIEALLELYTKDKLKFNVEEESLNVEEQELEERLKEIAETRVKKGYKKV